MRLQAGQKLGEYEIQSLLGAGGMGEVYRALDRKLDREVAIKVLPGELTRDNFSLGRFEREARAVAALSHPNIVRIFDYGQENEDLYSVMELLEGETLRDRLRSGALPVSKAVKIAREVAAGLAAAHDQEIVHRDLKPENIFLTREGRVKILDFGLAKSEVFHEGGDDEATLAESQPGALLGTIEYMSPEQLRSQEVDSRSDIFAVGMVLHEMLSGKRPFRRESLADTMSSILTADPEPIELERPLPPVLAQILSHCLEKRPEERFQSARDLAFALSAVGSTTSTHSGIASVGDLPAPPVQKSASIHPGWWLAGLVLSVGLGYLWGSGGGGGDEKAISPNASFRRLTTLPGQERTPSLGPGGQAFAYVSNHSGDSDIYLQRIGGQKAIELTSDSDFEDTAPSFSPDGQTIAFRSERQGGGVFLMGATGESVRRLTDFGFDPSWSPDGQHIVVAGEAVVDPLNRSTTSSLWVVQVDDGSSRLLSEGDAVQPDWSPNGHRIAFFSVPSSGQRDLFSIAADGTGEPVRVTEDAPSDWSPLWSPDGKQLYFSSDRGGAMSLWRVAIDESTGQTLGEPEALTAPAAWAGDMTRSADGKILAYATRETRSTLFRVPVEIDGAAESVRPESIFGGSLHIKNLDLSPDGKRVTFTTHGSREDLFIVGLDGKGFVQLTDDAHRDRGPKWSPDGERIAFYSNRSGRYDIWAIRADGSGLEQLTESGNELGLWYPTWSPDGSRLAIAFEGGTALVDLDNQEAREILPAIDDRRVFQATSWSMDGLTLGGWAMQKDGTVVDGLWVYSIPEARYSLLSPVGRHPVWSETANGWLAHIGQRISFFGVESQEWHPLFEAWADDPAWRTFAISDLGKEAAFIESELGGDIWLMTLE